MIGRTVSLYEVNAVLHRSDWRDDVPRAIASKSEGPPTSEVTRDRSALRPDIRLIVGRRGIKRR
jgi:hypothetical protein